MTKTSFPFRLAALFVTLTALPLVGCSDAKSPDVESIVDEMQAEQVAMIEAEDLGAETASAQPEAPATDGPVASAAAAPPKPARVTASGKPKPSTTVPDPTMSEDPHAGHDMSTRSAEDMKKHD